MVEQAQAGKAGIQRLADRICAVFVPAVLACAALTLAGWLLAGSPAGHAVSAALAVLIIACPCALGLATPAALVVASGRGAQLGIFIKGYQALESSRAIDTVVLDKTGTVTTGQMTVTAVQAVPGHQPRRACSATPARSSRPPSTRSPPPSPPSPGPRRSRSPTPRASPRCPAWAPAASWTAARSPSAGPGCSPTGASRSPADLAAWCRAREQTGCTTVLVAWDDGSAARSRSPTRSSPRPPRPSPGCARLGLRTVLLTGDNAATARAVADAAGIGEVISEALPAAKARVITELQAAGRSVAMVGDGVNDGPALAAARLGLALGSGTDVAIVRRRHDPAPRRPGRGPDAIALARATFRTIRRNLAWAFCYNVLAIPLAALGFLNPLVAAATMTLSSVFVVWNSLRLRRFAAPADTW